MAVLASLPRGGCERRCKSRARGRGLWRRVRQTNARAAAADPCSAARTGKRARRTACSPRPQPSRPRLCTLRGLPGASTRWPWPNLLSAGNAPEAARRCQCSNNLSQLGLAVHHYEFNAEYLPSGVINPDGPIRAEEIGQHVSWIVGILPYIEQSNAYRKFDQAAGAYAPVNKPVRSEPIAILTCPSHPNPTSERNDQAKLAFTNYAGCHHDSEAPINDDNNGVLFLNSRLRLSKVLDGLSQTILLGEMRDNSDSLGWVSGTRSTLRNTGSLNDPRTFDQSLNGAPLEPVEPAGSLRVGGFGSYHTGGAQFVFADGSSRFISSSIDKAMYQKLGNRADGELLGDEGNIW